MLRKAFFIGQLLLMIPVLTLAQTADSKKETVEKTHQLLKEMGLFSSSISVYRDSGRVYSLKGSYFDLFFKDRKLYNLKGYDKGGSRIDSGNFQNGSGVISIKHNNQAYYVEVEEGYLNGWVKHFSNYGRAGYKLFSTCQYKDGLKEGECTMRSYLDQRVIANRRFYTKGQLLKSQSFGIRRLRPAFNLALFKFVITEADKLCQETIYENGNPVSHNCFVKRCDLCGN